MNMKKYLTLIILMFAISCGWNDSQWNVIQKIDEKFKILKDPNDERAGSRLVSMGIHDSSYNPLIDNCTIVYYNSNYIYVKSLNFNRTSIFTKIKRDDSINLSSTSEGIEVISEQIFNKQVLNCEECLKIDLSEIVLSK